MMTERTGTEIKPKLIVGRNSQQSGLIPFTKKPPVTDLETLKQAEELNKEFASVISPEKPLPIRTTKPPVAWKSQYDTIVDAMIEKPNGTLIELGKTVGFSTNWVSMVTSTDMFKLKLAARRKELGLDELIIDAQRRAEALLNQSLEVVADKLETLQDISLNEALDVASAMGKLLGMGNNKNAQVVNTNNFVVHVPPVISDSEAWRKQYAPQTILEADS